MIINILLKVLQILSSTTALTIYAIIAGAVIESKLVDLGFKLILKSNNALHLRFIKSVVKAIVVLFAIFLIGKQVDKLDKFITAITASSGLLVVVLGFAAQESLSNILNGMLISIFKPFRIGDRIKMLDSNLAGVIEDITLRHTVIRNANNSRIIVPNNVMNKEKIENSHFIDARTSMFIDIPVDYDADIHKAMSIMENIVGAHPLYLDVRTDEAKSKGDPKISVVVRDIGTNGIWLRANVWTSEINNSFKACSDIKLSILDEFKKSGIKIYHTRINDEINS